MIVYLKDKIYAIQTLIITNTTYISNRSISITICGIRNKIHRLLYTQTIGNKIGQIVI